LYIPQRNAKKKTPTIPTISDITFIFSFQFLFLIFSFPR
jgi:hypothetical protein